MIIETSQGRIVDEHSSEASQSESNNIGIDNYNYIEWLIIVDM